jgi:chemotaxis protein histidine kinase CheA
MIDTHRISISGATISGDGTVALNVDVPKLVEEPIYKNREDI